MSVSDNSTVTPSRDNDGSYQLLDTHAYGEGDVSVVSEKSPYAGADITALYVGPDATRFNIHGTILCQSATLAAMAKQHVPVVELDEATAHTLIHYLYTSKYQALYAPAQTEKTAIMSYKLGTCVYCAAVRYELPRLAELAKEKITTFGEDVSISNVLSLARDHALPLLPEGETWYPAYLEGAVRSAMAEDPEPFKTPDFITQIEGNSRLLQVVWKTVMSSYSQTPVIPKPQDNGTLTPTAEVVPDLSSPPDTQELVPEIYSPTEVGVGTAESGEEASSVDDQQFEPIEELPKIAAASKGLPELPTEHIASTSDAIHDDALELGDIEPTVDTPQAPDPFTDELGFETSKMYQQMGKKPGPVTESQSVVKEEPNRSAHKRSDSVMQVEDAVPTPMEWNPDKNTDIVEATPLVANGSNENITTSKKAKKGKKKKLSTVI